MKISYDQLPDRFKAAFSETGYGDDIYRDIYEREGWDETSFNDWKNSSYSDSCQDEVQDRLASCWNDYMDEESQRKFLQDHWDRLQCTYEECRAFMESI